MLAVSGAFLVGLTSLHVVVLTNLGALAASALYSRHVRLSSQMLLPMNTESGLQGHPDLFRVNSQRESLANEKPIENSSTEIEVTHT
jgi:hypothetical protein